jgi:TolB protein
MSQQESFSMRSAFQVVLFAVVALSASSPALADPDRALDSGPVFSADGGQLFFHSDRRGGGELFAFDLTTRKVRQLTDGGDRDRWVRPSPDGEALVFMSRRAGDWEIFRLDVDGGEPVQLTRDRSTNLGASWRGDDVIYFGRIGLGGPKTFKMSADGDDLELVTDGVWPNVSPDGRWLAFVRPIRDAAHMMLRDLETGEERRLDTDERPMIAFGWTPDSAGYLYGGDVDGRMVMHRATLDGSETSVLGLPVKMDSAPNMSPDGRFIVWVADLEGDDDIYLYDLETGAMLNLSYEIAATSTVPH